MPVLKRTTLALLLVLLLASSAVVLGVLAVSRPARAQVNLDVNDMGDNTVPPYTPGQLRWAIDQANNTPAGDTVTITFSVDFVLLQAELPALTRDNGDDPNITIDGDRGGGARATVFQGAAVGATGLTVNTDNCTVQNVVFENFDSSGVHVGNGSGNALANIRCYNIDGNGVLIDSDTGTSELNLLVDSEIQQCALAAPGPAGSSADFYGVKIIESGGSCAHNAVDGSWVYDCGDFTNHFGGGIGVFASDDNHMDGTMIGSSNGFIGEGNAADGVTIADGAQYNSLGNGERNIIMDNDANGVRIAGDESKFNQVIANNIGVNQFNGAAGNGGHGITISGEAGGTTIGQSMAGGVANLIGSNGGDGIAIDSSDVTVIIGNGIGTDDTLALDRGNGGQGIAITNSGGTVVGSDIGQPDIDEANYIGNNGGNGTQVAGDSPGNSVLVNRTTGNGGAEPRLGIDISPLADQPNDPATYIYGTPGAPNLYMPYPNIDYAAATPNEISATGTAVPGSTVVFYYSDDGAGYGEGETFLGWTTADGTGDWQLLGTPLTAGEYLTATAMDGAGNTSEFCQNRVVENEMPPTPGIAIDAGAEATADLPVTLTLAANDDEYPPDQLQYQVSNYADFHDVVDWTQVPGPIWTQGWGLLPGADGYRTVYIRERNPEMRVGNAEDTIYYKTEPPTGTVKINNGAAATASPNVTLKLTASDTFYDESDLEMAISNYSDLHDASWQAFDGQVSWTLLGGTGNRTVYVRFRDPLLNTSTNRTDSIFLDQERPTGSVAVKGGAQATETRDVQLTLTVTDNHYQPSQCIMQVSNHPDFAGVSWQGFRSSLDWTLLAGTGQKTVYAHFRDGVGNTSDTYSCSIYLDAGAGSTWYLAEGSSAWGFSTYITVENPNPEEVTARVTYMTAASGAGGGNVTRDVTLPASSQTTIDPGWDVTNSDFSTKVECLQGKMIAVDRTMSWTGPGAACPGAHSSIGVAGPTSTWYLAEGSSAWGFETWVLVQNPNQAEATVNLLYMIEGEGPVNFTKKVPALSRASFSMATDIGSKDASIKVSANMPVIAERALYLPGRREGTESVGEVTPATASYLAEGTTAWGFTTYVLVQNPNAAEAEVRLTYMTPEGPVAQAPFTMPAQSRKTVRVNDALPGTDFSTMIGADRPVVAERAMYWESGSGPAAHGSIGVTAPHASFFLPDGQRTDGWETWVLVQNPNGQDAQIELRWLGPEGQETVATDTVPANSRRTYDVGAYGTTYRCATVVTCTNGLDIIAERAMYRFDRGCGTDTIGAWTD
ncbi:MAG: hypothetical protein KKF41_10350 [Actinobacteria bacterium]|nr:hypothetical protein [Actinomycetota bacterium]MBU1943079.1 hypothetical protein [Actinomycetota bacterium]MBU2687974.1 hypothetical protein [Actinomycetota bacterium]